MVDTAANINNDPYESEDLSAEAFLSLGDSHQVNENYDEAIDAYASSLSLLKDSAIALRIRALSHRSAAFFHLQRYQEALEDANDALALLLSATSDSNSSIAGLRSGEGELCYRRAGLAALKLGKHQEATGFFVEAAQLAALNNQSEKHQARYDEWLQQCFSGTAAEKIQFSLNGGIPTPKPRAAKKPVLSRKAPIPSRPVYAHQTFPPSLFDTAATAGAPHVHTPRPSFGSLGDPPPPKFPFGSPVLSSNRKTAPPATPGPSLDKKIAPPATSGPWPSDEKPETNKNMLWDAIKKTNKKILRDSIKNALRDATPTDPKPSSASMLSKSPAARTAAAAGTQDQAPKYQYYQTNKIMTVVILEAGIRREDLTVRFAKKHLVVMLRKNGVNHTVVAGDLESEVDVDKCKILFRDEKVLIKLRKAEDFLWYELLSKGDIIGPVPKKKPKAKPPPIDTSFDADDESPLSEGNTPSTFATVVETEFPQENSPEWSEAFAALAKDSFDDVVAECIAEVEDELKPAAVETLPGNDGDEEAKPAAVPSLPKDAEKARPYASHKDWDAMEKDIAEEAEEAEEESPEGEVGLMHFFQQIYANADDDARRAMNKSYEMSGGTALTNDWKQAAEEDYEKDRTE